MKTPFLLPVSMDGHMLVSASQELIANLIDATRNEKAFIMLAINSHEALVGLLDCAELNQDSIEPETADRLEAITQMMVTPEKYQPGLREALQHLLDHLHDLGFGTDESIDGGDTVDAINKHYKTLKGLVK